MAEQRVLPALANRPELPRELEETWEAFWSLNRSRQIGFSIGPIPLSEIRAYVELFRVVDVRSFVECVRHMDGIYLKDYHAKHSVGNGD
jgi:hypothetical protein